MLVYWAVESFTKGLNLSSSIALFKLIEILIGFEATAWAKVYSQCAPKILLEDDQSQVKSNIP